VDLTNLFSGYKSYAAALGFAVTAVVQFSAKDYLGAAHSALAALATFGVRAAIERKLGVKLPDLTAAAPAPQAPVQ
jgi:hypothetical protein